MRSLALFSCVAAAPLLMAAVQPVRLRPSSHWVVEYAENSCRLLRSFSQGDSKVVLLFESEAPDQVDMLLLGKPLDANAEEVPARFLPEQGKPLKGRTATSAAGPAILFSPVNLLPEAIAQKYEQRAEERRSQPRNRPPPLDLAEEAQTKAQRLEFAAKVTELEIDAHRNRPVVLETGSLGEAIKMFDKCGRDSLRDWGVDPDLEDRIVRPAWSPNVRNWFTASDYPPDMARQGQEAEVKVRLLVDASGKVTKCTSLSHFKERAFNDVLCDKFMRRAQFEPAELADGTKVPSFYTNRIVFRLER